MISSMTGFGEATAEVEGMVFTIEVKTVNHRYLKSNIRLADTISFCEEDIEKLLRKRLYRGSVSLSVKVKHISGQGLFEIDEQAVSDYLSKMKAVADSEGLNRKDIDIAQVFALPGAIVPTQPDENRAHVLKEAVVKLTSQALDELTEMRKIEGEALMEDVLGHCKIVNEKLELIRQRYPEVVQVYHQKLQKRADELLNHAELNIDGDILAREVAVFADRSDIAEETSRLATHLEHFEQTCRNSANVGRRLDFLSQEMLREANTIGSKACDTVICGLVIDIKCAIDRIKEQVQNIE